MEVPNLVGKYVKGLSAFDMREVKGQVVGSFVFTKKGFLSFIFGGDKSILMLVIRTPFGSVNEIRVDRPIEVSDNPFK